MNTFLESGARNCVVDCAEVRSGTRLFVVSEVGAVEEGVVAAILSAGRAAGGIVEEVWGGRIPKDRSNEAPPDVLKAYEEADVIVSHYPSLKREVLFEHIGNETRIRVPNRARTAELLSSDWARFPYGLQRIIAERLDEIMSPGRRWRITSPTGTDLTGSFASGGGEVGAAFFVDQGEGRARRNFPGGVHSPRNCADVNGVILVEYMDGVAQAKSDEPLRVEVKDGRIVSVIGGDRAGKARAAIQASDGWIDSWHAGVNPRTEIPIEREADAKEWFTYSHCSPDIMHFHLGRTHATTNLASFGHSLQVGEDMLYRGGRLAVYDDPGIVRELARSSLPGSMKENKDYARW